MNHDKDYPAEYLAEILKEVNTIAMVGASSDPTKFSYGVLRVLHETGYDMIPVNPKEAGTEIRGRARQLGIPRAKLGLTPMGVAIRLADIALYLLRRGYAHDPHASVCDRSQMTHMTPISPEADANGSCIYFRSRNNCRRQGPSAGARSPSRRPSDCL